MVRKIFTEDITGLEYWRIEQEQKTFNNLEPVEAMEWDELE